MRRVILACVFVLCAGPALAVADAAAVLTTAPMPERALPMKTSSKEFDEIRALTNSHPNERNRLAALEAYAQGRDERARELFRRAARFADKYSQQRLAIMHWYGQGGGADPVMAYVWADLAAERGYPGLLAMREEIWAKLSPEQQRQAVSKGQTYYGEFGDAVAKPRLEKVLFQRSRQVTGSRTGWVGALSVIAPDRGAGALGNALGGGRSLADYYAEYRWDPKMYWKLEDALFGGGEVEVGPLQKDDGSATNR
jgi:hypothetical protein